MKKTSDNWSIVVFFFQAEDGIRDRTVTGVQTCALPISPEPIEDRPDYSIKTPPLRDWKFDLTIKTKDPFSIRGNLANGNAIVDRSEERRVGKECRSLRAPYQIKENEREKTLTSECYACL